MPKTVQHNTGKTKKNIVLVGVAGVGKTTMGQIAAEQLNMAFVDMELGLEVVEEADIDTMVSRYGKYGFEQKLLSFFREQIRSKDHTIFAASPRVLQNKAFWTLVKQNGISIHLQGNPSEIYMRQEIWLGKRQLT